MAERTPKRRASYDAAATTPRESGEPPTFGADLGLLANEIAAGRLLPQVGLEASWTTPLTALESLRQRNLEGKAVLLLD